jgi:hypothetical protein
MSGINLCKGLAGPVIAKLGQVNTQFFRKLSSKPAIDVGTRILGSPEKLPSKSLTGRVKPIKSSGSMKKKLSFEEFKAKHVETFQQYSAAVRDVFGDDPKETEIAYNEYCGCLYFEYERSLIGGNPVRMI